MVIIEQILATGFDVNAVIMKPNITILMLACSLSHHEAVQSILKHQPHINLADSVGRTALHYACRAGSLECVRLLLERSDINIDQRTNGGETPLMFAALSGKIELVGECLNRGFNPFLESGLKQTARDFAAHYPNLYGHNLQMLID